MGDRGTEIVRGIKASAELQETEAAFEAVETALLAEFRKCPVGADARILKLHASLQIIEAVRTALIRTVTNGKTAEIYQAAEEAVADAFDGPATAD